MFGDYTVDPPTVQTAYGRHEALPAEASFTPPTTHLALPPYLSRQDRLSYDPLGGAASSLARYMSDDSPISTMSPLVLQPRAQWVADVWTSGSDSDGSETPALAMAQRLAELWSDGKSAPAPAQALQLADVWTDEVSGTEASDPAMSPLGPAVSPAATSSDSEPALPAQALQLANVWTDEVSGIEDSDPDMSTAGPAVGPPATRSDSELARPVQALLLADVWTDEGSETEASNSEMAAPDPALGPALSLADRWSSGSAESDTSSTMDDEAASSQYTYGSQLAVSPSQITLDHSETIFIDTDNHFPSSDNLTPSDMPVSSPARRFGPKHFSYLQDHMFDEVSSDEDK
ncbi:hypothetical protein BYT27DRAFT_7217379 [Phlegmacium glaucopus]|nr:hypothetical protein BYT27DRAFT_7217379 [Phlegmacium glaucopus]